VKVIGIQGLNLEDCLKDAQQEAVVLTRRGRPVALVVGVDGMDLEQLQLALSAKFWALIKERRQQPTISRVELEQRLADD
jgi:antitoxin (DNA-binding transcriptional repressor) of toxin-antitoxin stability system